MKSPYVLGGLLLGAAGAGYFAVTRGGKRRALKAPPLLEAPRAVAAPEQNRSGFRQGTAQPSEVAQKSAGAAPRGNRARQHWQIITATVEAWLDDFAPSMGAALSYYTLFSLAPLLIIVIAVAGMVFGQVAAQGEIVAQLREIMGDQGAVAVEALLTAARDPTKGVVATIVGLAILLLGILDFAVSLGIFTLLFAMIYKVMPRASIPWRDVWTGAAVTALLFTVGKGLIAWYLARSGVASGFGAAGALVLLLAWVYYCAQVFLFGAEYTWVYANRRGSRVSDALPGDAPAVPSREGVAAR